MVPPRTDPVVDDHGLTKGSRETRLDCPGNDVCRAACRQRHDKMDGLGGIVLGVNNAQHGAQDGSEYQMAAN